MTRIGGAAGYIRSRQQGMTITEETLLKHAKNELETAVLKTKIQIFVQLKNLVNVGLLMS